MWSLKFLIYKFILVLNNITTVATKNLHVSNLKVYNVDYGSDKGLHKS